MVDARGGARRCSRNDRLRFLIAPRALAEPTRITCRFVRRERLSHVPRLSPGEAFVSRCVRVFVELMLLQSSLSYCTVHSLQIQTRAILT